ncbi:hypothetical protein HEM09_018400, partial [Escherichia coli]|nr:hypothetical protein [Escherichia coli]
MSVQINNIRPEFDREIVDIVDYVMNYEISSRISNKLSAKITKQQKTIK